MSALGQQKSGTPHYTAGWGTRLGFPVTSAEKGLGIYTAGWFGGQPVIAPPLADEIEFRVGIKRELVCVVGLMREFTLSAAFKHDVVFQASISRETAISVTVGRERAWVVER